MQGNTEKSTFTSCNNPVKEKNGLVDSLYSKFSLVKSLGTHHAQTRLIFKSLFMSSTVVFEIPHFFCNFTYNMYCQSPITVNNVTNFIFHGLAISKWSYIFSLSKNLLYLLNTKERFTFLFFRLLHRLVSLCRSFPMPAQSFITAHCSDLSNNVFFLSNGGQDFIDSNIALSAILLL